MLILNKSTSIAARLFAESQFLIDPFWYGIVFDRPCAEKLSVKLSHSYGFKQNLFYIYFKKSRNRTAGPCNKQNCGPSILVRSYV